MLFQHRWWRKGSAVRTKKHPIPKKPPARKLGGFFYTVLPLVITGVARVTQYRRFTYPRNQRTQPPIARHARVCQHPRSVSNRLCRDRKSTRLNSSHV